MTQSFCVYNKCMLSALEKTGETDSVEKPKSLHGTPFGKVAGLHHIFLIEGLLVLSQSWDSRYMAPPLGK